MEPQKKLLMIVNPRAGRSKPRGPLYDAAAAFCDAGYLLSIRRTAAAGDARRIAEEAGGAYDTVVAVGGDGTLNEVISGLQTLAHPPVVGYLPQGSTNDFAAILPKPPRPLSAGRSGSWISAASGSGSLCMWRPSARLPAPPTPPLRI